MAFVAAGANAEGAYVEYKITSDNNMNGTMKMLYNNGNSRVEMEMVMPASMGGAPINMTSLILKDEPKRVYMLNEEKKTYTTFDMKGTGSYDDADNYEITVVGKEKVNNYNATHIIVKEKDRDRQQELWVSTEVPGYGMYTKIQNKYTHAGMYKAMEAKGVKGYAVRVKAKDENNRFSLTMDLIKAETKAQPDNLFTLAGYTKAEGTASSPGGAARQEMMERLKNMTPEERQKFIEEMRKQNTKNPDPNAPR